MPPPNAHARIAGCDCYPLLSSDMQIVRREADGRQDMERDHMTETMAKAPRGKPAKGETATVHAKVLIEKYELLQSIRADKGWSLVTTIERAITALAEKEGRL